MAIAAELKKILPSDHEIIFASGGNAYEMIKEEKVRVEQIPALRIPENHGKVNFFKFYFAILWSEFLQLLHLRRMINEYRPSLIILDEFFFLTDYCRFRKMPVIFICDFLGIPRCSFLRNPLRWFMEKFFDWLITHWQARRADRYIFVGDIDQVPSKDWRQRARELGIVMVEPITKLQYTPVPPRREARAKLGFNSSEKVVTVSIGCAGVGEYLLKAANAAAPLLAEKVPELRMEIICGKGIDSGHLARIADSHAKIHDYVRNFHEFIAASDAALLQSGLTATLECIMAEVPMIVVPLANHWEQVNVARYLVDRFDVRRIDVDQISPKTLSDALFELLDRPDPPESPFRGDGHVMAARAITEVINTESRSRPILHYVDASKEAFCGNG
jgi:hypothetical protein